LEPKGYQKATKSEPKGDNKCFESSGQKKGERWTLFYRHVGAIWSISNPIFAPTGFRRADPLGVSRCIWRYRKTLKNKHLLQKYTAKVGEAKYIEKRQADRPS
jgi:hypothetical protein